MHIEPIEHGLTLNTKDNDWLHSRIRVDEKTGCWFWLRGISNGGYAQGPSGWFTHRWTYTKIRGPIPPGKVLDHVVCDARSCVNPWHTEPRTQQQNVLRGSGPSAVNARKTHCLQGHLLSGENVWLRKQKGRNNHVRVCRECARSRWRKCYGGAEK